MGDSDLINLLLLSAIIMVAYLALSYTCTFWIAGPGTVKILKYINPNWKGCETPEQKQARIAQEKAAADAKKAKDLAMTMGFISDIRRKIEAWNKGETEGVLEPTEKEFNLLKSLDKTLPHVKDLITSYAEALEKLKENKQDEENKQDASSTTSDEETPSADGGGSK